MQLPKSLPKFLWHFMKQQPIGFAIIFITAMVWSINETFFPYFLKLIINAISNYKGNPHLVFSVLIGPITALVCIWVIMETAMRTQGITVMRTFPAFRANIRMAVF